ncbi:hypothetical protein ACIBSV_47100 [Embleya sp. NPDC050154]|uniref:hypothetical protein n=1 Tax=Embleya sp. NPDC050154 TaxID=3363988 RepID=UPI0037A62F54
MTTLITLAAIATGAITIAALALLAFLRDARRRTDTDQRVPDPAWLAAYVTAHSDYRAALVAEMDVAALRTQLDAWGADR